jgi:hypothetical protein
MAKMYCRATHIGKLISKSGFFPCQCLLNSQMSARPLGLLLAQLTKSVELVKWFQWRPCVIPSIHPSIHCPHGLHVLQPCNLEHIQYFLGEEYGEFWSEIKNCALWPIFKRDTRHLKKWLISTQRHQMLSSCPLLKSPSSRIKKGPDISSDFVTWWR